MLIIISVVDVEKNKLLILHSIFRPPSIIRIEKNPQHSPAKPAVFINRDDQIRYKAERDIRYISYFQIPEMVFVKPVW